MTTQSPVPSAAATGSDGLSTALRRLGPDTVYVLTGLPISLVAFVLAVTGISVSAGLLVTVVGIPVLTLTLLISRGLADLERMRAAPVLGTLVTRPRYRAAAPDAGWWRRTTTPITDPQSWLDLAHGILNLPIVIGTWTIVLVWWTITLGGLGRVLYEWALPQGPDDKDLPELLGMPDSSSVRIVFYSVVGLVFALTLVPVVRGCALAQAGFARALLSGVADFKARVRQLEEQTAAAEQRTATAQARTVAAVSAEATALRRLERDIHDGPQQRLVRLAMDLGRARHQLDGADPQSARDTVTEAIEQAKETLAELRALSRGIAPPILADRGLAAALAALAGRSTVPVDLAADDLGRLASSVESTAYFVVAEALTNVAKHSQATECQVSIQRTEGAMLVRVSDNGIGGADIARGHGLAGLDDRVRAAGGRLTVASVPGTGTVITAELPL